MDMGIEPFDKGLLQSMIYSVAPIQNRNYVVMEVRSNVVKDERATLLQRFSSDTFKKVAHVQLGEPNKEFKAKTQEVTLAQKQKASDIEFRRKQAQEKQKKAAEKKAKEVEK